MNSTINMLIGDDLMTPRLKRVTKAEKCTGLDYGTVMAGTAADVANDIGSMEVFGVNFSVFTASAAAVSHTMRGTMEMERIALGCADIPFDEIKGIMRNKFNEVNIKLDKNTEALEKISTMVSKTLDTVAKIRIEMHKGFNQVVYAIENDNIRTKVDNIHNVVEYFQKESDLCKSLNKNRYIAKLKDKNDILTELKVHRISTLHSELNNIIRWRLAIPNDASDLKAFQALYALFYGTQTYVSIFAFLIEAHSDLADYYYQIGKYNEFNEQLDIVKTNFDGLKTSILGNNVGLLEKVKKVLDSVKNKNFSNEEKPDIYKQVEDRSKTIETLEKQIISMELPIIEDIPGAPNLKFKKPDIHTPFRGWKTGTSVRYAVQYEKNGMYSKLSEWSDSHQIKSLACPHINAATAIDGRKRLIFRQFDNHEPELVGILKGSKTGFRDINRELYNAAGEKERDVGFREATKIINHGANVNSVFEFGRTVLHNAAKSGNVKVMNLLFTKKFSNENVKDKKGYTALHIAAESDNSDFIGALIRKRKGIDLNAATFLRHYTPLHLAALKGFPNVVTAFARNDETNVNAKDKYGYTPLHFAANQSKELFEKFYYHQDLDRHARSKTGLTPAHIAAIQGKFEIIEDLTQTGHFKINTVDINNLTPLHYAAISGNSDMVRNLMNIKDMRFMEDIDLNVKAIQTDWTPLHFAIFLRKEDAAIELIKAADINVKASGNVTPLHMAAGTGQLKIVNALLTKNATLEEKTTEGYTALHLAAINNNKDVAIALVNQKANKLALSNDGKTPLDLAKKYENDSVKNYLSSLGEHRYLKIIRSETSSTNFSRNNLHEINFELPVADKMLDHGTIATYNNELSIKSLQLLGQKNDFRPVRRLSNQSIDSHGTLLLLYLMLRKFTKDKYTTTSNVYLPEFEAQAKALTTTEKFEDILNTLSDVPAGEHIDFFEVYTSVKKALMNGRGRDVAEILCSYAEMLVSLKAENKNKLMEYILSTDPVIFNFSNLHNGDIMFMISETCDG